MEKNKKRKKKSYSKLNSTFKKFILFILAFIGFSIIVLFELSINSPLFWMVLLVYFLMFMFILPEMFLEVIKIFLIILLFIVVIFIFFAWLSGGNIPYTRIVLDNDKIIALFTIILTIATIISTILYRQTIGFTRLSEVDFELNKILCVEINNKGNYPARDIHLTTQIINSKKKAKFKKKFEDIFRSPEDEINYLPSKGCRALDLRKDLTKRFNIKYNEKTETYTSITKKKFNIRIELNYKSDTGFRNPLPIIKEYHIEVNPEGTIRKEIPYSEY